MSAHPGDPSPLPPFGPALSRPPAPPPAAEPAAPGALPPFAPFSRPAPIPQDAAPEAPAEEPRAAAEGMPWESAVEPAGAEESEDLPWLSSAPEDEPAATPAMEGAAEAPAEEELPEWLSWVDGGDDALTAETPAGLAPAEVEAPALPLEDFLAADDDAAAEEAVASAGAEPWAAWQEPGEENEGAAAEEESEALPWLEEPSDAREPFAEAQAEVEEESEAEAAPGGAAVPDEALRAALDGVADRLERIASALRERPAELLAGTSAERDPLELLVTGFVLGYAQGRGRSGG